MSKIEELYERKKKADSMPAAREQFRAEYDAICAELKELLVQRGGLPVELLNVRDDMSVTIYAIGALSHEILSGTAKPEQYDDWVKLWRSLVVFEQTQQEVFL